MATRTWMWRLGALFSLGLGFIAQPALAAVQLDSGSQISQDSPYSEAQTIPSIFENRAIYGKLEGTLPIDIYKFTPDKDGDQLIRLMVRDRRNQQIEASTVSPYLFLVDPTDATQAEQISLPLPTEDGSYHLASIASAPADVALVREHLLFQQYQVTAQQNITFQKDKTYYFIVYPSQAAHAEYVLQFGRDNVWTIGATVKHFGTWIRLQTNTFAGSSPFKFAYPSASLLVLWLGSALLVGMMLLQEGFSLAANKFKAAGYLLVRMQPVSRVVIWVSMWITAIGGYLFFSRQGWVGLPFVITTIFLVMVVNMLFVTIKLSPKVAELEVTKREATIPFALRKRWFFSTLVTIFSLGAFITFLAMYFATAYLVV